MSRIIIVALGLFLLLTLSFGVGYLVGREVNPAPIVIEQAN